MTLPSLEYMYASDLVYPKQYLLDPLLNLSQFGLVSILSSSYDPLAPGVYAQAFRDAAGNVVIAYEGTRTDFNSVPDAAYSTNTLVADVGIAQGNWILALF
jgi:hypothetical protein